MTDDRMDRARRIREMREGVRPEEQADDRADDADAGAGTDPDGDAEVDADTGPVEVDAAKLAQQAGLSAGDADAAEAASGGPGGAGAGDAEPAGATDARRRTVDESETRVLEFALGDERYCLDIEYVEEIVKRETVTRVPNTPDHVEGVVDLRGQITTVLDPKVLFDIDVEGSEELIVVFDPDGFEDQGAIGWLVDDVNQVMPVADSEVNESPIDQDHVNGVVDRDGEFVIWTRPELAVEDVAG